jgi:hypothetical protein
MGRPSYAAVKPPVRAHPWWAAFTALGLAFGPAASARAAAPGWVRSAGDSARYPARTHLVGYGSADGMGDDARQAARTSAEADVARAVRVAIRSQLDTFEEQRGEAYRRSITSAIRTSTSLSLRGIQSDTYVDPKEGRTHALVHGERAALVLIYKARRKEVLGQLKQGANEAAELEKKGRSTDAAAAWLRLMPPLEELAEVDAVLLVVGRAGTNPGASEPAVSSGHVQSRVAKLLRHTVAKPEDAAKVAALQLATQHRQQGLRVLVLPPTLEDTGVSSSFARFLRGALEVQLRKSAGWNVVHATAGVDPRTTNIARELAHSAKAEAVLAGIYWRTKEGLLLHLTLRRVSDDGILAGASIDIPNAVVSASGLAIAPPNLERALANLAAFAPGAVSSGPRLELWTNRGDRDLLFSAGETMKVYVRVNRAAHVRLLYNLADGDRVLLYDSHFIDPSKANKVVEIPAEFECAAPFGVESLFAVVSTVPLPRVNVAMRGGYAYLQAASPAQAAVLTRGFKRKRKASVQSAEAQLTITTVPAP